MKQKIKRPLGLFSLTIFVVLGIAGLMTVLAAPATAAPTAELHVCASGCTYTSVQTAVDAANPGDTIKVAAGTYTGVQTISSLNTTTFTATQMVAVTKSLTIRGGYSTSNWTISDPNANPTILDAQGQGRVFAILGSGTTPAIENLNITNGDADGLGGTYYDVGGGIYIANAAPVISGTQIFSNTAGRGGGLGTFSSNTTLTNSVVYHNEATGGGKGVYLYLGSPIIANNTIRDNGSSTNGNGGGVNADSCHDAVLRDNVISGNKGGLGGGAVVYANSAILSGNVIVDNQGVSGGGLALYNSRSALDGNLIISNTATGDGGGIYMWADRSTLVNTAVVSNAINSANKAGAGIYAANHAAPHFSHTTIAGNSGGDGSGLHVALTPWGYSTAVMTNTIISDQPVGITVTSGCTATLNATLWDSNGTDRGGAGAINLSNDYNGSPAFAADGYHLTASSAAIDRGVDAGVTTDVDDAPRPAGGTYDLGADEYPSAPPDIVWEKQIQINGGAFQAWDNGPFVLEPGQDAVIVDRVWVTATAAASFVLTDTWDASLGWVSSQSSAGTVSQSGSGAVWSVSGAAANSWHVLTQTVRAVDVPTYGGALTETLVVQGAAYQPPSRIIHFEQSRPQPAWEKVVSINGAAFQSWQNAPFPVHDGDTIVIVDRVAVTHTANVSFVLTQTWGSGLTLSSQSSSVGSVTTGSAMVKWTGTAVAANQQHILTSTLQANGTTWLSSSITESLVVGDAVPQLPQRVIGISNLDAATACAVRINNAATIYPAIQLAVDAATTGDLLKVAGNCTAVNQYGSLSQIVYLNKTITIRGGYSRSEWDNSDPVARPTLLNANEQGRVFYIFGSGNTPTIENLNISGGNAAGLGGNPSHDVGGGIYIANAAPVINNVKLFNNIAEYGGGLGTLSSNITLTNSVVYHNEATGGGKGVYLYLGSPIIANNTIRDNGSSLSGNGGGIHANSCHDAVLRDNSISGNKGMLGGGVVVYANSAILSGNVITDNQGVSGGGLALYNSRSALDGNLIISNTATGDGGGVYMWTDRSILVNTAVVNNVISNTNKAGAGIYAANHSYPHFSHTTIAGNSGGDGSGLHVALTYWGYSTAVMTNTIISDQRIGITVTSGCTATLNATLWDGNGTDRGGAGAINHSRDYSGSPAFAADGYHLTASSAAIDRGVDAGVTTDIDGGKRPLDNKYDIGADEALRRFYIYLPAIQK